MSKRRRLVFGLFCSFLLSLGTSGALADTQNFSLTNYNIPGTGPFATVQINQSGNTATFTFDSLTTNGLSYFFVDGGSVAANINGAFTLGPISGTAASGFTQATYSDGGAGNEDGWGSFNQTINSSAAYSKSSSEIVFTVTKDSGTWSSALDVLALNDEGHSLAAHLAQCTAPCTLAAGAIATGFATDGAVPEPRLLSVLALGMAGLLFQARRRSSLKTPPCAN